MDFIETEAPNLWGTIGLFLLTGIGAAVGAAIFTLFVGTLSIPVYYFLGTLLLNASVVFVTAFFITPLAWLLSHPRLEFLTRLANITLFLIGFHFDLLAS